MSGGMTQSSRRAESTCHSRSMHGFAKSDNQYKSTDVRLVPIEHVRLHERYDPKRVKSLKEDLLTSGILRDPPIAAMHAGRTIILDGATRTTALREIGAKQIVVQVVQYAQPQVMLDCWYHIVQGVSANQLDEAITIATGVSGVQQDISILQRTRAAGQYSFALLSREGYGYIYPLDPERETVCMVLNQVFDTYAKRFKVIRMTPSEAQTQTTGGPGHACIVAYPRFTPAEILRMGSHGCKLPAGITRHIVNGRVTNLMVPLDTLINPDPMMTSEVDYRPRRSGHRSRAPC